MELAREAAQLRDLADRVVAAGQQHRSAVEARESHRLGGAEARRHLEQATQVLRCDGRGVGQVVETDRAGGIFFEDIVKMAQGALDGIRQRISRTSRLAISPVTYAVSICAIVSSRESASPRVCQVSTWRKSGLSTSPSCGRRTSGHSSARGQVFG